MPVVQGLRWSVPCDNGIRVTAAQLRHRVPCWGYVFREATSPPKELPDKVQAVGMKPGDALAMLKQGAKPSQKVQTTAGDSVPLLSLFSPPAPGRKVVLLGDTCDSTAIEGMSPSYSIPL